MKNIYLILFLLSLLSLSLANGFGQKSSTASEDSTIEAEVEIKKNKVKPASHKNEKVSDKDEQFSTEFSSAGYGFANAQTYPNLADAISTIGSLRKHLTISSPTVCSAPLTVPANIILVFTDDGKVIKTQNCKLTIDGQIVAVRTQIFSGFRSGELFLKGVIEAIYPEWFGAKGDYNYNTGGGTDDYQAIQTMFDAVESSQNSNYTLNGGHFVFATRAYYSSDTIVVRKSAYIEGTSGAEGKVGSRIAFPANKTGFIFHGGSTETGVDSNKSAYSSSIERIGLLGATGGATHTVNTVGLNLTKTAGQDLVSINGYGLGQVMTISQTSFIINNPTSPTTLTFQPSRFVGQVALDKGLNAVTDIRSEAFWVGGILTINGVNYKISGQGSGYVTLSTPLPAPYLGDMTFTPPNLTGQAVRFNVFHGIDSKVRMNIQECLISNFAGNAVNLDTTTRPTAYIGGEPNTNYIRIQGNRLESNQGHGIYMRGTNANAGYIEVNDATDNRGYGYYDNGFLGNNYFGNHAASNYLGHYFSVGGAVNRSNFYGNYGEEGSPSNFIGQNSIWIGGNPGNGFDKASEGGYIGGSIQGAMDATAIRVTNTPNDYGGVYPKNGTVTAILGATNTAYPRLFYMNGSTDTTGGYQIDYGTGDPTGGWYTLRNETFHRTKLSDVVLAWSGSQASEGAKKLWMPQGTYLGTGENRGFISTIKDYAAALTPAPVAANTSAEQTFTVTGLNIGDRVTLNPPNIGDGLIIGSVRVSAANTLAIRFGNLTARPLTPAAGTYLITIIRH